MKSQNLGGVSRRSRAGHIENEALISSELYSLLCWFFPLGKLYTTVNSALRKRLPRSADPSSICAAQYIVQYLPCQCSSFASSSRLHPCMCPLSSSSAIQKVNVQPLPNPNKSSALKQDSARTGRGSIAIHCSVTRLTLGKSLTHTIVGKVKPRIYRATR